jgi:hypothetical protein
VRTKSLDQAIIEPYEVGVSSGHFPLKRIALDGVDSVAFLEETSLDNLRPGYSEGNIFRIYKHCLLHYRAPLSGLIIVFVWSCTLLFKIFIVLFSLSFFRLLFWIRLILFFLITALLILTTLCPLFTKNLVLYSTLYTRH